MEEGSEHAQNKIAELRYEEAFIILNDIMEGIVSIENTIQQIDKELPLDNIINLSAPIKEGMSKAVACYEQGKESDLYEQIAKTIIPDFRHWKEEIEKILRPCIIS
jgi:hypothetical protein